MYFNSFLKHFLEKKYVSELLSTFFFKFCPILKVNHRTIGDNNGTIEDFASSVSLSYEILYVFQVSSFYLSPFRRYKGEGVHFIERSIRST